MYILSYLTVLSSYLWTSWLYVILVLEKKNLLVIFKVLFKIDVSRHDLGNYLV